VAEERVDRRLAAILCADVAGYSRLMGLDEEGTHRSLCRCRTRCARRACRIEARYLPRAGLQRA
jgi:class 3 adenylate cyclase